MGHYPPKSCGSRPLFLGQRYHKPARHIRFEDLGNAYSFLLASLILERLFDALVAIPAILEGLLCRHWAHLAGVAVVIAAAVEAARYASNFQPVAAVVTWACAAAWGSLA